MKSKITLIILSTLFLVFGTFGLASAKTVIAENGTEIKGGVNTAKIQDKEEIRGNSTSTEAKDKENEDAINTDDKNDNEDESISDDHRDVVASFVQSLLMVADREGGIGERVREIARTQNDSASTTARALKKVENRGALRTFFFGSDYKNLGAIRSEIAKTSANIEKLKTLLNQTTNDTDRAQLNTQITALEAEQAKIDTFVKDHEDTFSLFGWFNRLFVK